MSKILPKNLLMIVAHPDDETFLSIGLLKANSDAGGQNVVICATRGEKGMSHLTKPMTKAQLGRVRTKELQTVLKKVGRTKLVMMNLPDGGLATKKVALRVMGKKVVKTNKPDMIVSFGRDGITAHRDHVAAGDVAREVAKAAKIPLAVFTYANKFHKRMPKWLMGRRANPHYGKMVPYRRPKWSVAVDPIWKLKMILLHRSQVGTKHPFHHLPKRLVNEILGREYYG